jgi:class 3 adenylate cyclase
LSLRDERIVTVVFSDIRGFSSLAERLPPREVADIVGGHLAAMAEVVQDHGGTLDKFVGDAVMAVFGAPQDIPDHAARAIACAIAMQRRQSERNAGASSGYGRRIDIGIGINTGTVVAGTLGGVGRLDYTVIGDAVNVAQRLQGEAGREEILASAATIKAADYAAAEKVGSRQLKGRQESVEVYRISWSVQTSGYR